MYQFLPYCLLSVAAVAAKEAEDWTPCIEQTVHAKAGGFTNMTIRGASQCYTAVFQLDDGSTSTKNITSVPCRQQETSFGGAARMYRIAIGLPQYTPVGRMNLTFVCAEGSACRSLFIDPVDPANKAPLDDFTISRECMSQTQNSSRPLFDSGNTSASREDPYAAMTRGTLPVKPSSEASTQHFLPSSMVSPDITAPLSRISCQEAT